MTARRKGYEGVVVVAPTTAPYQRFSIKTAHWWIARALGDCLASARIGPRDIDGFSVASFTLFPDTAVGLTQHLGLSVRWLDHVPLGGACGVVALRRAARAVRSEARSWIDKEDRSEAIQVIEAPTLIVHGEDDAVLTLERAEPMANVIPNAQFVAIPGAGHSANLEQPELVNTAIREFLNASA